MRKLCWFMLLAAVVSLTGCAPAQQLVSDRPGPLPSGFVFMEPEKGAAIAPDGEIELLDGSSMALSQLWMDRPVLLVFAESWCVQCADQERAIQEVVQEYGDAVPVITITRLSSASELMAFAKENQVEHLVGRDVNGDLHRSYAVSEAPLVIAIAKGGALLRGWRGPIHDLLDAVESLLAERVE